MKTTNLNNSKDRLINKIGMMGQGELADEYFAIAYNVEDALLYGGGIPGKDYTLLDIYKLAQPFALEAFRQQKLEFTYPADKLARQSRKE